MAYPGAALDSASAVDRATIESVLMSLLFYLAGARRATAHFDVVWRAGDGWRFMPACNGSDIQESVSAVKDGFASCDHLPRLRP